ncbi:MAG: hypothetical protein ACRCXZ_01955 [Patescibacteria group bacterium]
MLTKQKIEDFKTKDPVFVRKIKHADLEVKFEVVSICPVAVVNLTDKKGGVEVRKYQLDSWEDHDVEESTESIVASLKNPRIINEEKILLEAFQSLLIKVESNLITQEDLSTVQALIDEMKWLANLLNPNRIPIKLEGELYTGFTERFLAPILRTHFSPVSTGKLTEQSFLDLKFLTDRYFTYEDCPSGLFKRAILKCCESSLALYF